MNLFAKYFFLMGLVALFQGCYSLSGAPISPEIKTISFGDFPNNAPLQQADLSQILVLNIQNFFVQRSPLSQVQEGGDISISGEITDYRIDPVSIQSNDVAAQDRLSITVKINYVNAKQPDKSFERSFSDFEDFDAANPLVGSLQVDISERIVKKITEKVFNETLGAW